MTLEEKIGELIHYSIGVTDPHYWTMESKGKFFAHSYYMAASEHFPGFEYPDGEPKIESLYSNSLEELVDRALEIEKEL